MRAVAREREFMCDAMRILFTSYALLGKSLAPPAIRLEGMARTLGTLRTLSRVVKDAARVETPPLRVFDARYGYVVKYNMPAPKGPAMQRIRPNRRRNRTRRTTERKPPQ